MFVLTFWGSVLFIFIFFGLPIIGVVLAAFFLRFFIRRIEANRLKTALVVIIIASIIAVVLNLLSTTAAFNRLNLGRWSLLQVPTLVVAFLAAGYIFAVYLRPKLNNFFVQALFIIVLSVSSVLMLSTFSLDGWVRSIVHEGSTHTTVDGLFEYRLTTINPRQRNVEFRIYAQNTETGEISVASFDTGFFNAEGIFMQLWFISGRVPSGLFVPIEPIRSGVYTAAANVLLSESPINTRSRRNWFFDVDFTNGTVSNLREIPPTPPSLHMETFFEEIIEHLQNERE